MPLLLLMPARYDELYGRHACFTAAMFHAGCRAMMLRVYAAFRFDTANRRFERCRMPLRCSPLMPTSPLRSIRLLFDISRLLCDGAALATICCDIIAFIMLFVATLPLLSPFRCRRATSGVVIQVWRRAAICFDAIRRHVVFATLRYRRYAAIFSPGLLFTKNASVAATMPPFILRG